jgi:hypothetical protein
MPNTVEASLDFFTEKDFFTENYPRFPSYSLAHILTHNESLPGPK